MITHIDLVKQLVSDDREYRKNGMWPLVGFDEVLKYLNLNIDDTISYTDDNKLKACELTKAQLTMFDSKVKGLINCTSNKNVVIAGGYVCDHIVKMYQLCSKTSVDDLANDIEEVSVNGSDYRYVNFNNKKKPMKPHVDIDVFLYGPVDKCQESLREMVNYIKNIYGNNPGASWSKSRYVLNFSIDNKILFQFITKAFENKSYIIGQFDINASAIMYDGDNVLFTPLSALSYATMMNYVDTYRKSPTYEHRLAKYFKYKSFNIAFPELATIGVINKENYKNFVDAEQPYNWAEPMKNQVRSLYHILIKKLYPVYYSEDYAIYADELASMYGGTDCSLRKMIDLVNSNKMEKIYFKFDIEKMTCDPKKYVDMINMVFIKNQTNFSNSHVGSLKKLFDKDSLKLLFNASLDYNSQAEKEISINYGKSLIKKIDDFLNDYGNSIIWEKDIDPLKPSPMEPEQWYQSRFRKIF